MITCDICGTLNFKEDNYCSYCGYKLKLKHICPNCGENNSDLANFCENCGEQINPVVINDFDMLFSEFNADLLANAQISDMEYNELLSSIFKRADYIKIWGGTIKDKILNFASIFTECNPKSRGFERGYIFIGVGISFDDRLDDSVQIATIIHELAHYLLFTIIETVLCNIFKVKTSSTIQSFIWYFLNMPEFKIMNEYCAHTVEGRFIPYGYQNYGSFNALIENLNENDESLEDMVRLGNSFANELIIYLEKYITGDLRDEIKLQYRKDLSTPSYESIFAETDECFSLNLKNSIIINVLYDIFIESSGNDIRVELESIKEMIESI